MNTFLNAQIEGIKLTHHFNINCLMAVINNRGDREQYRVRFLPNYHEDQLKRKAKCKPVDYYSK